VSDLADRLNTHLTEAILLRGELPPMPGTQAAPHEVHEHLLDVRRRLDRVEHLLALGLRVRAMAHRGVARSTADAEEAWDDAILRVRSAPVRRGDEYSSARERAAEANLATIEARRAVRAAQDAASHCDEAVDVLRTLHRGLDSVRQDTLAVLRLMQFESHLER